ncbi:20397_t:CDS:2 [Dentiscutata erythropus]|uniref:20397_t:CDS:1 n=1 Tax=Dentiscutata erythropus TaxID=1348616 RepID=A0A9N8VGL8_9GLOM|nr:20397_t:CDS:2 [Dentiscutata erythropus]
MPELKLYLYSHSICEKHYNQVIFTNYFYNHLLDNPALKNKRAQSDTSSDDSVYEENDELYTETRCIETYECTIAELQQQLQEQENRELIIITEFQRNIKNQDSKFDKNKKLVEQWNS